MVWNTKPDTSLKRKWRKISVWTTLRGKTVGGLGGGMPPAALRGKTVVTETGGIDVQVDGLVILWYG